MNPIIACAEAELRNHAHPALRLSELLELVAERVDRTLDDVRLRSLLEACPDRFRIFDPSRGPWRILADQGHPLWGDVWVVALVDPTLPPNHPGATALKLRESVRWLARGIDPRSTHEVSRWHAIALSERAVRQTVRRRAA